MNYDLHPRSEVRQGRGRGENQYNSWMPPCTDDRYVSDPRISMRAGGNHQSAASNRPDTRKRLTRSSELDKKKSRVAGDVHTRKLYTFSKADSQRKLFRGGTKDGCDLSGLKQPACGELSHLHRASHCLLFFAAYFVGNTDLQADARSSNR